MLIESLGWFLLGAGSAVVGIMVAMLIERRHKLNEDFKSFISKVREDGFARSKQVALKEISELTFRDKSGKFDTVKIIVDPDISPSKEDKMEEMIFKGTDGKIGELVEGAPPAEDMVKVKDFVFSSNTVRDMRASGIEPEDVVVQMLKASGRM